MKPQHTSSGKVFAGLGVLLFIGLAVSHFLKPDPHLQTDSALSVRLAKNTRTSSQPNANFPMDNPNAPTAAAPPLDANGPAATDAFLQELVNKLDGVQNEKDPAQRERKLENLAKEIAVINIPTALKHLNAQRGEKLNEDLSQRLIQRWMEASPAVAADWVNREIIGSVRQQALNTVAISLSSQNLSNAVAWARQLQRPEEQQSVLLQIAYETTRAEPLAALNLAVVLPAEKNRDDFITHATREWAAKAPQAAAAWAVQVEDVTLRERMVADIAATWGEQDALAAATLAMKSLPPGRHQDDAVVGIVQQWVQKEPESAAAWVTTFPTGSLREVALENVVKLWTDQNPEQVGNWLNGLEPGSNRDLAIKLYAIKITPSNPGMAARWVESVEDETVRLQGLEAVATGWLASDAAAARAWIAQTDLPELAKARLLAIESPVLP